MLRVKALRLHRKRDSVHAIVYTAFPSKKDVRAAPCHRTAKERTP